MNTDKIANYMTWQYPGHTKAYLSEFFAHLSKCETDDKKVNMMIEFLRAIQSNPRKVSTLRIALSCLFDPTYTFDLPAGMPSNINFHKFPDQVASSLYKTLMNVSYFIDGSPSKIQNQRKRELVFLQYLEAMHHGDAVLFVALKDKDLNCIGLTQDVASRAFPGWVSAPVKQTPTVIFKQATKAVATKKATKAANTEDQKTETKRKPGRPKKTVPLA